MKKILSICLAALLLVSMLPCASASEPKDKVSSWAEAEVARARELGLIDLYFGKDNGDTSCDLTVPITRRDFCSLAVNYVELQNHFSADQRFFGGMMEYYKYEKGSGSVYANPFTDEGNYGNAADSYTAYYLNIAVGDGNRAFRGDSTITRQEAAAILIRAYQTCGGALPEEAADVTFTDGASIADWARDNASALSVWGIMKGDEQGNFDPLGQCSYEQAAAMFLRLYNSAPVSRVNGNVKPVFTYEQCMEWLRDHQGVTDVLEGSGVTFARRDDKRTFQPATALLFVYRDGGIREFRLDGEYLTPTMTLSDLSFSEDGKTFTFRYTIPVFEVTTEVTVDEDTLETNSVPVNTPE